MNHRKTLFIYDCDGTICAPIFWAYAMFKKNATFNSSLAEFKEKHHYASVVTLPGITDLVQYTANLGDNVLISGGDPIRHNDPELQSTFPYFKNWQYAGQPVPFGQEPEGIFKSHPSVAESLFKNFKPDKAVVIGDSEEEFILAKNLSEKVPTTFIFRGSPGKLFQSLKGIPKYCAQNGTEILEIIQKLPEKYKGPGILEKYSVQNKTEVFKILKEAPKAKRKRVAAKNHLKNVISKNTETL